ncbi:hypothetical protein Gotur_024404 [Gossypium turneri]
MNWVVTCDPSNARYVMSSNFDNFPKGPEFKQMLDALRRRDFQLRHGFVEKGLMPIIDHAAKHGLVINLKDISKGSRLILHAYWLLAMILVASPLNSLKFFSPRPWMIWSKQYFISILDRNALLSCRSG